MGTFGDNTKLCDLTTTNNDDFMSTPITPCETKADSFEISPTLLNLVMKEQFGETFNEDVASHVHNFVKVCDMQKYKEIESDYVKLKLFAFSLRARVKEWLLSLPKGCINSWNKCKYAFIGKYYPPAKIIQLKNLIMNFKQYDH